MLCLKKSCSASGGAPSVPAAHGMGIKPFWDYDVNEGDSQRYYRGNGNYNDWAMDYLPYPARRKPD